MSVRARPLSTRTATAACPWLQCASRESGGIGRRPGFRFQCRKAWGFESPLSHHGLPLTAAGRTGYPARCTHQQDPGRRSGNPVLKDSTFLDLGSGSIVTGDAGAMTLNGTVNKTGLLLVITLVGAMYSWSQAATSLASGDAGLLMPLALGGAIGGFIVALVTIFKKAWSPVTAPLYAGLEGLFLGAISAIFEMRYPGIVMQAVGLTFGTLAALLLAYRSGLIRATENFKLGVVAATGGIALLYLVNIGMRLFGFEGMGFIHEGSTIGILFSVGVVIVAALNLVLDFDFIENGVEQRAPKYMEWYAAFSLLVTLVWLYLEILRLLSKLQSRD